MHHHRWGFLGGKGESVFKDITNCQKTKNFTISAFNHHRSSSFTAAITSSQKQLQSEIQEGELDDIKLLCPKMDLSFFHLLSQLKDCISNHVMNFFFKKEFYVFHVCGCFVHKLSTPERASDSIGLPL